MQSFTHLINQLNDGSVHAALTNDLAELIRTVQNAGRGGDLTIKIKVAPAVRNINGGEIDRINITCDRKLGLPKPDAPADFFYLTEDGETTRNHPRQQSLELREVPTPNQPVQLKEAAQ